MRIRISASPPFSAPKAASPPATTWAISWPSPWAAAWAEKCWISWARLPRQKPIVSGVDGLAIGIGTTIHMHCDLTVASDRSLFKTPFVDLALVPEAASSLLAPRLMGHQRAFALLALGEGLSAADAKDAGLIWKVTTPDALEAETLSLATRLAAKPPEALRIARNLIRGSTADVLARIDEEATLFAAQLKSAEARAAFEAFMKR